MAEVRSWLLLAVLPLPALGQGMGPGCLRAFPPGMTY